MKNKKAHLLIRQHKVVLGIVTSLIATAFLVQSQARDSVTGSVTSENNNRIEIAQTLFNDDGAAAGGAAGADGGAAGAAAGGAAGGGSVISVDLDFVDESVGLEYKAGFTQVNVMLTDNQRNLVAATAAMYASTYGKTGRIGLISGLCSNGNPVECSRLISRGQLSLGVSGFPPGGKCYLRLVLSIRIDESEGYRELNPANDSIRINVPSERGATEECPSSNSSSSSSRTSFSSISRTSSSYSSISRTSSSSTSACAIVTDANGCFYHRDSTDGRYYQICSDSSVGSGCNRFTHPQTTAITLLCPVCSSSSSLSSRTSISSSRTSSISSRTSSSISSTANGPDVVLGVTASRQDDYVAFRYIARNDGNLDTSGYVETMRPSGYVFEPLQSPTCRQMSNGVTVRCYTSSADRYMAGTTRQHVAVFRRGTPTAPCTVENTARVVIVGTADRNPSNNTDSASVTLLNCGQTSSTSSSSISRSSTSSIESRSSSSSSQSALPDITLNTQATTVNDTALFRYTISNRGNRTTAGYVITQRPSGYAFDPVRSSKCQLLTNGISVQCLPYDGSTTLPAGSTNQAVAAFRKVSSSASCTAQNSAIVVVTGVPDATPDDNRSTAQITVESCDARSSSSTTSSSSQSSAMPEVSIDTTSTQTPDSVSFRYIVTNNGNANTAGYVLTQRPSGYVFESTRSPNCTLLTNGITVRCQPSEANTTLAAGTNVYSVATFRKVSDAASCTVQNVASVIITGPADSTPDNNSSTHTATVTSCGSSSSSVSTTSSSSSESSSSRTGTPNVSLQVRPMSSGDAIIFRYTVQNSGDANTTGYVLTQRPSGYTFDEQQSDLCTLHSNGISVQCLPSSAGTSILEGRTYYTNVVFRRVSANASCRIENRSTLIITGAAEGNSTDNTVDSVVEAADCSEQTLPVCGNGIEEAGEQCDDGNQIDTDGCTNTCEINRPALAVCGNGRVEDGEQCDDGNNQNTDSCTSECQSTADVAISLSAPSAVTSGEALRYNMSIVSNSTVSVANGFVLVMAPTGATFSAAQSGQGCSAVAANIVRCAVPTLPASATLTMAVGFTTQGVQCGVEEVATARFYSDTPDPLQRNNVALGYTAIRCAQ